MEDLVSIIIPVFNVEMYLQECIESVIDQTYCKLEILLINDGSTDKSLEICRKYEFQDSRIRIISKINEGLSVARELGILESKGKYFVLIDSDDFLDKDYIKKMYILIKANDADICLCARKSFDNSIVNEYIFDKNVEICNQITIEKLEKSYAELAGSYQMSDSWNKLYRHEFVLFTCVHFNLPRQYNGTDLLFNHLLLLHCPKITVVNEALYNYRIVPTSRVHRKNKPLQQGFNIIYEQLLAETSMLNYSIEVRRQISAVYVSMIKYVTLDIVEECSEWREVKTRIDSCLNKCVKFERNEYNAIRKILPTRLRLFFILMNSGNTFGICAYYGIRKLFRRMRGLKGL